MAAVFVCRVFTKFGTMANATKLFAEFKDLAGQQWRINIHDSEYSGSSPVEFTVGASGFVLSYSGDTENAFQPIFGSSIEFEFIEEIAGHTSFLDLLASATESRYTVTVDKYVSGSYVLHWFGVLLLDQWSRNNEPRPRSTTLVASDDLGNLSRIKYKNGASAYTGYDSLKGHLINALNKTRALHPFGTGDVFLRIADDFYSVDTTATDKFFANTRTHHESFWNVDDDGNQSFMNTDQVVVNVCKTTNARIFLANGTFHVVPVGLYQNDTQIVFHDYDVDGAFVSTATAVETELATGTDLVQLFGNETRFTPPISEARRTRKYNGNAPVLSVPYLGESDFTTTQTDFGIDYSANLQLNFNGHVNVFLPGADPEFGASLDRIGRVGVRVTFKCGSQYAVAPESFDDTAQFWFDDYANSFYDAVSYGPLVWQTTAAGTLFVSEPFDRDTSNIIDVPLQYTTPQLPSLQSGLEITLAIFLVEHDGNLVALDTGLNVADDPVYNAQNITVFKADQDGGGDEITFTAVGDTDNRAIKIDDEVLLGDKIGDSSRGVLQVFENTDWIESTGWKSTNYTGSGLGINRLAVNEILRTMRKPMMIHAGSMHVADPTSIGTLVTALNVLEIGGDTFMFTEFSFAANERILDFECVRIQRDTSAPTEEDGDKKNKSTNVFPGGAGVPSDNVPIAIGGTAEELNTVKTTVAGHDSILGILKQTFQPKSDGTNTITKVVYDQNKTDGLEMSLSQTTAAFTSNSGNSVLSITESSPGVFQVDVQDDGTNSVLAIYATANTNAPFVGIGTSSPSFNLDVAGRINASSGIFVNGTPVVYGTIEIDDLSDVDTTTTAPTNGDALVWDNSASKWVPGDGGGSGGGGSDSFNTISVSGQSDVVADSGNDTLTLAAGSNMAITTNATTDTITFAVSATPTFTSILTTGSVAAVGTLSTLSNATVGGTFAVTGTSTFTGKATYSAGLITGGIEFLGSGTSVIQPATGLPNLPNDLEIRSNGNVVVVLDYDDDETGQSFKIENGDGTTIFEVDETGVTSGLLTTVTPTTTGFQSSYQQGSTISGTVSNFNSTNTYTAAIYNSSGVEQTSNAVTIDGSGNISATAPSTIATGYELRIQCAGVGKFLSLTDTTTFEVTASRTFTHWRVKGYTSGGAATTDRIYMSDIRFFTGSDQTGTEYPTTNMTSNTSESGITLSAGHSYSSSYAPWKATDSLFYTGWWTLGVSNAANNWWQIEFDTAKTFQSIQMNFYSTNTTADNVKIFGSNTGNFTGEEIEVADVSGVDGGTSGQSFIKNVNI